MKLVKKRNKDVIIYFSKLFRVDYTPKRFMAY